MKAKCLTNEIKLKFEGNKTVLSKVESLIKDNTYTIFGIVLFRNELQYLIFDEFEMATWYPAENFMIIDRKIPKDWEYSFIGEELGIQGIWGYSELVENRKHYEGIIEQDAEALNKFMSIKKEYDL